MCLSDVMFKLKKAALRRPRVQADNQSTNRAKARQPHFCATGSNANGAYATDAPLRTDLPVIKTLDI